MLPDGYEQTSLTFCTKPPATFKVYVPTTAKGMERGLQNFNKLGKREGMLFTSKKWPKEEVIPMWQATVHYDLCMVFLSADGTVEALEFVSPGDPRTFEHKALACLEIPAEVAEDIGLRVGTRWVLAARC